MTLWKIVSGFGAIVCGMAMIIIILAACIWMVAGVIGWLLEHSFAEVFGGEEEEEFEAPYTARIPAPPPIPRISTPSADFRIYADVIATSTGRGEVWPREVWVVDTGHSKVAWSSLNGALDSVPDGASFVVIDKSGKIIQRGTKNSLVAYR